MNSQRGQGPKSTAMPEIADYPRVLFVTPVAFNPYSGGGATFGSLFRGWPRDRLATVHNDPADTPHDVCDRYFFLGPDELDFVPPFSLLRRRRKQLKAIGNSPARTAPARPRWIDEAREFLLGDSIPQHARLTAALDRWISDFRPEVLYTILGTNGMMSLVEQIRGRFDLPLVVHMMDDWPKATHRHGLFALVERRRMQQWLDHFFAAATVCLGICPPLCDSYTRRYGREFFSFQYALDLERWSTVTKRDFEPGNPPTFIYVGSIFRNAQLDSLVDCAHAIAELNNEGMPAQLRILTSADNCVRYRHLLPLSPNIDMEISTSDDNAFFQGLADADALLLPVNFDKSSVDFIRYSMPTKVPAYLNSGTPVLVYGPAETAQVRYAIDSRWALVVSERSLSTLKAALKQIMLDMTLRKNLSIAARTAAANHDARVVRTAFHQVLRQSARHQ
jgi:glycosyltransferase involved in cell wall biosynthesis